MDSRTYAAEKRKVSGYTFIFNGIHRKLDDARRVVISSTMQSDLIRYQGDSSIYAQILALRNRSYRFILFYRWSSFYKSNTLHGRAGRLLIKGLTNKYGFQVSQNAKISKGLYLSKFGNIVIADGSRLGENCEIETGVYIGPSHGNQSGSPSIGSKVLIGSNSIISGKVHIGNNVIIKPGSFINFDIPNNSIVSGQPTVVSGNIKEPSSYLRNLA